MTTPLTPARLAEIRALARTPAEGSIGHRLEGLTTALQDLPLSKKDSLMSTKSKCQEDISGQVFGFLEVVENITRSNNRGHTLCRVRCLPCGTVKELRRSSLKMGRPKSCGCQNNRMIAERMKTHGYAHSGPKIPEYNIWASMRLRCFQKNSRAYKDYGGRGITICDAWRESFPAFLAYMGPRPSPAHSIERIDNDGNYEPGNVRWATMKEQCRNRRSNRNLTVNGITKTFTEWSELTGLGFTTIRYRVTHGCTPEQALAIPRLRGHAKLKDHL